MGRLNRSNSPTLFMEQLELWQYMDPELPNSASRPPEPEESKLAPLNAAFDARKAGEPNTAQLEILSHLELHKYYAPAYEIFLKKKERAGKYLTTYVDARWQYALSGRLSPHNKITSLEANVAPSYESRKNTLRLKFAAVQKGKPPNISMLTYLHGWSLLERRMADYQLPGRESLKHAFSRFIATCNEGIYNLIRSAFRGGYR